MDPAENETNHDDRSNAIDKDETNYISRVSNNGEIGDTGVTSATVDTVDTVDTATTDTPHNDSLLLDTDVTAPASRTNSEELLQSTSSFDVSLTNIDCLNTGTTNPALENPLLAPPPPTASGAAEAPENDYPDTEPMTTRTKRTFTSTTDPSLENENESTEGANMPRGNSTHTSTSNASDELFPDDDLYEICYEDEEDDDDMLFDGEDMDFMEADEDVSVSSSTNTSQFETQAPSPPAEDSMDADARGSRPTNRTSKSSRPSDWNKRTLERMKHPRTIARQPWHNEATDKQHRQTMILEIARLLQSRKKAVPSNGWLQQLPHKARKLEGRLYLTATSLEGYKDRSTLKVRLKTLANVIMVQFKNSKKARLPVSLRLQAAKSGVTPRPKDSGAASLSPDNSMAPRSDTNADTSTAHAPMERLNDKVRLGENDSRPSVASPGDSDAMQRTMNDMRMPNSMPPQAPLHDHQQQQLLARALMSRSSGDPMNQTGSMGGRGGQLNETELAMGNNGTGRLDMAIAMTSSQSVSELERQKAVNARLQEQIVENIRQQEELVRRLQAQEYQNNQQPPPPQLQGSMQQHQLQGGSMQQHLGPRDNFYGMDAMNMHQSQQHSMHNVNRSMNLPPHEGTTNSRMSALSRDQLGNMNNSGSAQPPFSNDLNHVGAFLMGNGGGGGGGGGGSSSQLPHSMLQAALQNGGLQQQYNNVGQYPSNPLLGFQAQQNQFDMQRQAVPQFNNVPMGLLNASGGGAGGTSMMSHSNFQPPNMARFGMNAGAATGTAGTDGNWDDARQRQQLSMGMINQVYSSTTAPKQGP